MRKYHLKTLFCCEEVLFHFLKKHVRRSCVFKIFFRPSSNPSPPILEIGRISFKSWSTIIVVPIFSQINGESVISATHDRVVELIRKSGSMIAMKVVSVKPEERRKMDYFQQLPSKRNEGNYRYLCQYLCHVYVCICINIYICSTCTCLCISISGHVCISVCVYIYLSVFLPVSVFLYLC